MSGGGKGRKPGGAGRSKQESARNGKRGGGAKRETSAGGVVFRVESGKPVFLLIQDAYGNWGFPKGHVERGEGAKTAAVREVMEETGLRALNAIGSIDTIDWWFRLRGRLIHKNCEYFLMQAGPGEPSPQQSEGITACRWTPTDEAMTLIRYENARNVLRRAIEMLSTGVQPVTGSAG